MNKDINFFKGLNALRFFAAYLVLIHHIERIRLKYKLFNLAEYSIINNGRVAVTFFFVLSGFLITYLLLKEKDRTGTVSVAHFYMRRVLRIWPLYFLLVAIGLVLIPTLLQIAKYPYEMPYTFLEAFPFYLFFMPFMVNILFGHSLLEPLWSIGVEEVFYLIWAPLVKLFKNHIGNLLIIVFVCKLLLSSIIVFGGFPIQLQKLVTMLQFEAMAVGGAGAFWLFNTQKSVGSYYFFSKSVQVVLLVFIIVRLFFFRSLSAAFVGFDVLFNTPIFSDVLLQLVFCWLILNVSLNNRSIIRLDFKWLDFLGEISYGLYMYHMLVVFGLVLIAYKFLPPFSPVVETLFFHVVVTGLTIIISFVSKRYFEDWFNAFRNKFA